jgi:hypothetical protein
VKHIEGQLPGWCALLNCNLALNCAEAFLKPKLQNRKCVPYGSIHDLLLNRMAYYSRYATGIKKVVSEVSLLQLVLTWPSWAYHGVKPYWTQVLPCSSLAHSLWLRTTGVSLTLTMCISWVLFTIDPCPCGFISDFKCLSFICFAESCISKLTPQ